MFHPFVNVAISWMSIGTEIQCVESTDGDNGQWVDCNYVVDMWADINYIVVRFPDFPTGVSISSSYITHIQYGGGLYNEKLEHDSPETIYLAYGGHEIKPGICWR